MSVIKLSETDAVKAFMNYLQNTKLGSTKTAAQPAPPPEAMGGGMPPMDPSMMGGMPPMDPMAMGGAPPMDPAMMGGMPPMDPAMMGGMPMEPPKEEKIKPEDLMKQMNSRMDIMERLQVEILKALGVKLSPDVILDTVKSVNEPASDSLLPGSLEGMQGQEAPPMDLPPELLGGMGAGPKQASVVDYIKQVCNIGSGYGSLDSKSSTFMPEDFYNKFNKYVDGL